VVDLYKVQGEQNPADMLTKPLGRATLDGHMGRARLSRIEGRAASAPAASTEVDTTLAAPRQALRDVLDKDRPRWTSSTRIGIKLFSQCCVLELFGVARVRIQGSPTGACRLVLHGRYGKSAALLPRWAPSGQPPGISHSAWPGLSHRDRLATCLFWARYWGYSSVHHVCFNFV
jgi:hypothetical protein